MARTAVLEAGQESAATVSRARDAFRLLGAVLQLGVIVLLIGKLNLVSPAFARLAHLVFAGFVIHAVLPLRYRLNFFLALSLLGLGLVLGVESAVWTVSLGMLMIGICYLPLGFGWRVTLLLSIGVSLVLARAEVVPSAVPAAVWPVLSSMFMLRLIIFLYDFRHSSTRPTWAQAGSYFFLLPNVCFPMFPVVDYKTFERTYFDAEALAIYQRGLHWMARGLTHLVAYRFVYHYLAPDPTEVRHAGDLIKYVLSSFLLYLRVSGNFHLIVGLLHLFGFRLPETNHLYWLSSSFTDLWRRSNIYWKDAMMKLVYYPSFFRLRAKGTTRAIVLATSMVFVATWAFHSYQWFWLRGRPLFTWRDTLFYAVLGLLVVWATLKDTKRARTRQQGWSLSKGVGTVITMTTLCVLWSFWTADSIDQWLSVWEAAKYWSLASAAALVALLAVGIVAGGSRLGASDKPEQPGDIVAHAPRARLITLGSLSVLALIGWADPSMFKMVELSSLHRTLIEDRLNRRDEALMLRGYYEKIDSPNLVGSRLTEVNATRRPAEWTELSATEVWRPTRNLLLGELAPDVRMVWRDQPFVTNRWGMRDRDYELAKPEGTYRIAMIGASDLLGAGVGEGKNFESLLEQRLTELNPRSRYAKVEVLNFAVSRYALFQRAWVLDHKAAPFKPDLVVMVYNPGPDRGVSVYALERVLRAGVPLDQPVLADFVARHRIEAGSDSATTLRHIMPYRDELLKLSFDHIAASARTLEVPVVLLFLRQATEPVPDDTLPRAWADSLGLPVVRILDFENRDEIPLRVAEWDKHPSEEGHRYLADRLYRELLQAGWLAPLGLSPGYALTDPEERP